MPMDLFAQRIADRVRNDVPLLIRYCGKHFVQAILDRRILCIFVRIHLLTT